ncbi:MAG: hypothetical protein FWF12_00280 [Betaproteobacteria bacterium]|nr:hypothetical protein [Betaproteobacteria bacterium]
MRMTYYMPYTGLENISDEELEVQIEQSQPDNLLARELLRRFLARYAENEFDELTERAENAEELVADKEEDIKELEEEIKTLKAKIKAIEKDCKSSASACF